MLTHHSILFFMLCPIAMGIIMGIIHNITKEYPAMGGVAGIILCIATSFLILQMANTENDTNSVELVFSGTVVACHVKTETDVDGEGYPFDRDVNAVTLECDSLQRYFKVENSVDFFSKKKFTPGEAAFIYSKGFSNIIIHEELDDEQKKKIIKHYGMSGVYYWNFLWVGFCLLFSIGKFGQVKEERI